MLAERTPAIPVLGEEGGQGQGGAASGLRWLVDPIDGTVNFAHGLPIWSISIAAGRRGAGPRGRGLRRRCSAGGSRRRAAAARAIKRVQPLVVSTLARLDQALLVTGFPYDLSTDPTEQLRASGSTCSASRARAGGSAPRRSICAWSRVAGSTATGSVDLQPWDVAAGALIVAEAGGTVTDARGGAVRPPRRRGGRDERCYS